MPEEMKQEQVISRDGGQGGNTPDRALHKPLQGKRILVTRTREQASALNERLRALGAIPVEFPTIQIVPPQDWELLDRALIQLCAGEVKEPYYTWLVFTSVNGVKICCERLETLGYNAQAIESVRVAAIGPATAQALMRYGISADLVPGEYIAEGVAAALIADAHRRGESLAGKRILLARAAEARKILVTELQRAGAIVEELAAYRTLGAASNDEQEREVLRLLQARQLDILTFTSSSTVRHFMQWRTECAAHAPMDLITHNPQLKIACIGPVTSRTARELGLDVHIEASEFTIDGLVEAIVQHEEKT
jgi:uroporphyrinogen-III synthase